MASTLLLAFIGLSFSAFVCEGQQLYVKHAPSYVVFQHQTPDNPVSSSNLHNVIAGPLGLTYEKNPFMQSKSVLKRPKANVLITVVTHKDQELPLKNMAKFPLDWDAPFVDTENLMNNLQSKFLEKDPLMLDLVSNNQFLDVKTTSEVFQALPTSLRAAKDRLLDQDSILFNLNHPAASLNASLSTDGGLFAEMQMLGDVVDKLKENSGKLKTGTPDLLSFTFSGLKDIAKAYGSGSAQAKDAQEVVSKHLDKITDTLREIYKDNVMVEVLTVPETSQPLVRKTRSLMAAEGAVDNTKLNLALEWDQDFPVTFMIVLFLVLVLVLAVLFIAYGIWNMNPNLESILYRVPQDESKKLN